MTHTYTHMISEFLARHRAPDGGLVLSHLSDRALGEFLAEGTLLILTGIQRIMDNTADLAAKEQQIADDVQDINTHFDALDASVAALKDQITNGDSDAALAEATKIEAQLAALRGHVDAGDAPAASTTETGTTDQSVTQ